MVHRKASSIKSIKFPQLPIYKLPAIARAFPISYYYFSLTLSSRTEISNMISIMKLLPFLAILAPAMAQVVCETSDSSPTTEDVTAVINQLKGKGDSACPQSNNHGSKCTTHATDGTAKMAICGTFDSQPQGRPCGVMATFANAVQQECLSNGRVGGYYDIPNGAPVRVEISHT